MTSRNAMALPGCGLRLFLGDLGLAGGADQIFAPALIVFLDQVRIPACVACACNRLVPGGKVAVGIARTAVEDPFALGLPLYDISLLALRALHPNGDRLRILACRVIRAAQKGA